MGVVTGAILISASLGRAMRVSQDQSNCDDIVEVGDVVPGWAAFIVYFVRLILVPAMGLGAMAFMERLPGGNPMPLNATMRVVVALELASPAASNSIVLLQRLGLASL